MDRSSVKVTYYLGAKKLNGYIRHHDSLCYYDVMEKINSWLVRYRQQPRCEIRVFWIDEDNDEVDIFDEYDYDIFIEKASDPKHLHVSLTGMDAETSGVATVDSNTPTEANSKRTNVPPADCSYDFAVHNKVECDSCLMSPIVGFRYKCIQCPNYDLCQNCESNHMHSEHMMVRMPTNNCPSIAEVYITKRGSGRKHSKHSKTSCTLNNNGLSVAIDGGNEATSGAENAQQSSTANGREHHLGRKHHRRQNRHNFFSHLYEMMHDLAEGDGAAAAAQSMGESETCCSKSTTFDNGTQTSSSTKFTSNANGFENEEIPNAAAVAVAAARVASKYAHDAMIKAAEMASEVAYETDVAKNISDNMTASASFPAAAEVNANAEETKNTTKEKVNTTTTESQADLVPVIHSPSLEGFAQFLDPQHMRSCFQILNNFSHMFAKMLDPLELDQPDSSQICSNSQKCTVTSNKSSISSNLDSLGSEKKHEEEKSMEQTSSQEKAEDNILSSVEIDDLGSESENDSGSESFVKINVPKPNEDLGAKSTTSVENVLEGLGVNSTTSIETAPPKSVEKSNVLDFALLSNNLEAHIAQEARKESLKSNEKSRETAENPTGPTSEPIANTTSKKPEGNYPGPVYHADPRINNAVLAMMSMGFSNEGAYLTQLLESVNGNIPDALDVMSAAQHYEGR